MGGLLYLTYHIIFYFKTRVPIIITPHTLIKRIVAYLDNNHFIDSKSTVYELGSGWGDFSFEIEKLKPKKILAYELSPIHIYRSRLKAKIIKSNVQFKMEDFFRTDISDADIVYVYLMPKIVNKLWKKMIRECKKGTIMILLGHDIKGVKPLKKIKTKPNNLNSTFYYLYKV